MGAIRDELQKAFDEQTSADEQTAEGGNESNLSNPPPAGDNDNAGNGAQGAISDTAGADDNGQALGDQPSSPSGQPSGGEQNQAGGNANTDTQEALQPLPTWSQNDQEAFKGAPRNVQEWILRRDKEMNADYQRKTTEIAEFRRTWDPINQMFAPYVAQGINPQQTIQQWAAVAQQLQQNPAEALKALAQQYNVNLGGLTHPQNTGIDDQNWESPETKALREQFEAQQRQLQAVTAHLQQREQTEVQSRQAQLVNEIQAFAEQKTEAGHPAHPYFDEVLNDMMAQAKVLRANGMQPNVQDLYDQCVWANPTTRQKMIAAQQSAAAAKAQQEAIDKANRAKAAAKSVNGNATGEPSREMSIRESLESLL